MISYDSYKVLHLSFILLFFGSLGLVASHSPWVMKKSGKIVIGLVSFFILVAGMGLIARLGFKHAQAFPKWINIKIINWFLINGLLLLLFKIKNSQFRALCFALIMAIGLLSIWVVLNKPA